MKRVVVILIFLCGFFSQGQSTSKNFRSKKILVSKDSLQIDSISINPHNFKVFDSAKKLVKSTNYSVDFAKSLLIIDPVKYPTITIEYYVLPEFLTKKYRVFDKALIVPKKTNISKLYSLKSARKNKGFKPFDGLTTNGSISRGFTVGNNQDAVLNSDLDLQISGNLSDKVQLRASITDTNIPLQEGGYTQRLEEFDRVFIELFSDKWSLKAGDVNLINESSAFMRFNKKVAGVAVNTTLQHDDSKTDAFASGAIVRGQFARNSFLGQEANQGPYRITGNNVEQLLLIISGSETVYVNGLPLQRGENYDYTIDYNTAEITFTPTYPVTANMRIVVEYQFAERNFTRFVTYNGANYTTDKLKIGVTFYNENDAKNQTVQQDLTDAQRQILSNAGDNEALMVVPSARAETFSENAILYRKEIENGVERFVFSNDENDDLFNVRFSFVGVNQGNYIIENTVATGRIFTYVAPINGILQGNYEPVVQLTAPNKVQIATIHSTYEPSEKTKISTEFAYSINDKNLFSSLDDGDNNGYAGKVNWSQVLIDKKWKVASGINVEFVDSNFKTIERFRDVEFNRDWDIVNPLGNQRLLQANLNVEKDSANSLSYSFESLNFSENFSGIKHNLNSKFSTKNTRLRMNGSFLNNETQLNKTSFFRGYSNGQRNFKKGWIGAKLNAEHNDRKDLNTNSSSRLSHKFVAYEAYVGIGDTAKVFVEVGYNYRATDSVRVNMLENVNSTNTYYVRSNLIQEKNANLSIYANYRRINNRFKNNDEAFNSRAIYRQQLFNNSISSTTVYETNSGTLPRQEFSYLEVEPGQGFYTWIDYNTNGIQELDEFEVAQFPDQAIYVRLLLPSTDFIKTHQNKFSQSLTLNANRWKSKKGFRKFLSHFINQSFVVIDSKRERFGTSFNLNPFDLNSKVLGLNLNVKNSLFFNRGKQRYSTTYTYLDSRNNTAFATGNQESNIRSHQLEFIHKIGKYWLFDITTIVSENENASENFPTRNYFLENSTINPQLSYIYGRNARLEAFYQLKNKGNRINSLEKLTVHNVGANLIFSNKERSSLNASVNLFYNDFEGNENSAVAFQMLEGLRPGTNYTWSLNVQRKITSYLDINLNYLGRKSETSKAIHTGTIQLRASF